jgi:hypothetical protein
MHEQLRDERSSGRRAEKLLRAVLLPGLAILAVLLPCPELRSQVGAGEDGSASEEYEQLLQDANRKLLLGEILAAGTKFETLFEILVEDGVAEDNRYRIGVELGLQEIALRRGNYEKARDGLEALPASAKAMRDVALLQSRVLRKLGQYEQAVVLLESGRCCMTRASACAPRRYGNRTRTTRRCRRMPCSWRTSGVRCSGWQGARTMSAVVRS